MQGGGAVVEQGLHSSPLSFFVFVFFMTRANLRRQGRVKAGGSPSAGAPPACRCSGPVWARLEHRQLAFIYICLFDRSSSVSSAALYGSTFVLAFANHGRTKCGLSR